MRSFRSFARFALPCLALVSTTTAATLPAGIVEGPSAEGVTQYTLANGLTVLLFPDATQPKTTVNMTYLVGSHQENYGETGMAHLLEHLMFKGTPSHGNIMTELGRRGMDFNGSTWFDRTNYHETFPASDANLDWALAMEADRMVNSFISRKDLDSEMTVVRNEMESGENNPQSILIQRMLSAAFNWHNYGKEPIGARSDVEHVSIDRLQAFYRLYYQPDNAVLIVAGAFKPDDALRMIARHFGPIPRPARKLPRLYTDEPVQDGERQVVLRRVGDTQLVGALYHTVPQANPDYAALDALTEIMTIAPSGRLYRALVDANLATSVEGSNWGMRDPGVAMFFAQLPAGGSTRAVRDAMLAVLEGVKTQPITQAEIDRVRARGLNEFDRIIANPQAFAVALSESIASGDWRLFFLERDHWRKLTAADVQRVGVEYLKDANRTVGEFIPDAAPDRSPTQAKVDVAALVKDYKGDAPVAAGESFDPTPANLEARTQRFTLSNGMKVALLPKSTRGETVQLALKLHHGDEHTLLGRETDGMLAASMLMRGTAKHSRQQIEDALDALRARLSINGDGTGTQVRGQTVREHLTDALRLVAEIVREPAFPEREFDQLKRERATDAEGRRSDPEDIAERALARYENPYPKEDVRYVPTIEEEVGRIDAAKLENVKDFYGRFAGGAHAELALVGDFEAKEVRPLLETLFGSWQSRDSYARVPKPRVDKRATEIKEDTPDKANAVFAGELALPLTDTSPDFAALDVANYILGGSSTSRLWERIRQKEGLSYSVYSALDPSSFEPNTALTVEAIFAPENLARLRAALSEELARAVRDGFTAAEVADAKKAMLQERKLARTQDARLAGDLIRQQHLGRTFSFNAQRDAEIAAVSADSVNAALRKYVKPDAFVDVYAGDFAKKKD
jgi:zinc protease